VDVDARAFRRATAVQARAIRWLRGNTRPGWLASTLSRLNSVQVRVTVASPIRALSVFSSRSRLGPSAGRPGFARCPVIARRRRASTSAGGAVSTRKSLIAHCADRVNQSAGGEDGEGRHVHLGGAHGVGERAGGRQIGAGIDEQAVQAPRVRDGGRSRPRRRVRCGNAARAGNTCVGGTFDEVAIPRSMTPPRCVATRCG